MPLQPVPLPYSLPSVQRQCEVTARGEGVLGVAVGAGLGQGELADAGAGCGGGLAEVADQIGGVHCYYRMEEENRFPQFALTPYIVYGYR